MRLRALVIAFLAVAGVTSLTLTVACGQGGPDVSTTVPQGSVTPGNPRPVGSPSLGGTDGGAEPFVKTPAVQWAVLESEMPGGRYKIDGFNTYDYNITSFANGSGWFKTPAEGETYAKQWKLGDGTHAEFIPNGQLAGVLNGAYYVTVETFVFGSLDGAKQAFDWVTKQGAAITGSEPQAAKGLGNQSTGFRLATGKVGTSSINAVSHRFIFRRGNMIGIVQTMGAEPYMTIDQARDIAIIMDDKALGKRGATVPTPVPTPLVPRAVN